MLINENGVVPGRHDPEDYVYRTVRAPETTISATCFSNNTPSLHQNVLHPATIISEIIHSSLLR